MNTTQASTTLCTPTSWSRTGQTLAPRPTPQWGVQPEHQHQPLHFTPSLHFAAVLACDLGQPVPNQWLVVADKIKVPFDPKRHFHPEFDGYQPGEWTQSPLGAPPCPQDFVSALDVPLTPPSVAPAPQERR